MSGAERQGHGRVLPGELSGGRSGRRLAAERGSAYGGGGPESRPRQPIDESCTHVQLLSVSRAGSAQEAAAELELLPPSDFLAGVSDVELLELVELPESDDDDPESDDDDLVREGEEDDDEEDDDERLSVL